MSYVAYVRTPPSSPTMCTTWWRLEYFLSIKFCLVPPVNFATVEASYRDIGDFLIFNISLPERLETDIDYSIQIGDEVTMVTRNTSIFAAIDKNAIGSSRSVTVTAINQCQQMSSPFTVEAIMVSISGNKRHEKQMYAV